MAKKLIATCDLCPNKYAAASMHIRAQTTNSGLNLTASKEPYVKQGPFDLCQDCLNKILAPLLKADPAAAPVTK